jgi:uncharacterized protein YegL
MVTEEFQSGIRVLPIYIVCDESSSMAGASIQAVNDGIVELFYEVSSDPFVDAKVRVGIVTFNDTARVLFPLTQLSDVTQIPVCVASGSSSFSVAFRLLKTQLETDVSSLRQQFSVHRPVVFFVTNGQPNNENWRDELDRLIDPEFLFRPNIVSIGVTGAEETVIAEVFHWASKSGNKSFVLAEDLGITSLLRGNFSYLVQTVVASANSN